jgi:hypothetical protein
LNAPAGQALQKAFAVEPRPVNGDEKDVGFHRLVNHRNAFDCG